MAGRNGNDSRGIHAYASSNSRPNAYQQLQRSLMYGSCFNCGESGHMIRQCPYSRQQRDKSNNGRDDNRSSGNRNSNPECRPQNRNHDYSSRRGHVQSNSASNTMRDRVYFVAKEENCVDFVSNFTNKAIANSERSGKIKNWVLDCVASDHITYNRDWFSTFTELVPFKLQLGQGTSIVTGKSNIVLQSVIEEIIFSHLDKARYHAHIYDYTMTVYADKFREPLLIAVLEHGLYHVKRAEIIQNSAKVNITQVNVHHH
uniref:CCHC-type domain-containing protein n=1 Tax=Strigamia maritima TaxID=126957 RepID=T1JL76_STRMM